ncbi:hypothetical protein GUITHDRAFT_164246 [Guillardia theta CCMP2712]|uniref:ABC1 atypical kinase-like domain-containing protein n=1 Tax=Guillardia theta (strain CCMP2712) TaxID=905079 RepID=L1J190_GUITC|nr:hypothetical protein GUITHDRAFT_164246 [Guillardia theta CCMP2712]EKX41850.1 hypothetical protein GUITHDRAFT_164246 [Guillardia theta CCMP2712]|eukprot:XP_005828830.1 hypothetical protein GUITHDRAFT_164246 [Guillardia theta CCMP2712]
MPPIRLVASLCLVGMVSCFHPLPSFTGMPRKGVAAVSSRSGSMRAAQLERRRSIAMAVTTEKEEKPSVEDLSKLSLGAAQMLYELEEMRTKDILKAYNEGKIGKREASTLTLKRVGTKLGLGKAKEEEEGKQGAFMEGGWVKRGRGSSITRTIELYSFGIKIILRELKLRKVEDKAEKSAARKLIAKDLRAGLLELGPTFIKLGQLLSTRIDILTKEYIDELKLLQDNVPGFSGDKAVEVIERELKKPISEVFSSFDKQPIAAASLGQVHKAVLKSNGKEVAVKVQRTGLDDLFKNDLQNLKFAAKVFDKLDPKSDGADRDWVSIYEESAKLLYQEIDYQNEAKNAIRFRKQFEGIEWIKVPEVFRQGAELPVRPDQVPYLRKLSELKYGSETKALAVGWAEKTGLNNKDIFSVVKAPKNMQYVTETLERMERGELKVRVRALEAEQRLQRLELMSSNSNAAVLAGLLLNTGLVLSAISGGNPTLLSRGLVWAGVAMSVKWASGIIKLKQLDKKLESYKVKK